MVADAFAQGGRLLDAGQRRSEVLQHIIRALCQEPSKATPAAVMQALQNLVVLQGTPFSVYVAELRLVLANVRRVGQVAPEDATCKLP